MEEHIRRMIREEIRNTLAHMFATADSIYTDHACGDADSCLSRSADDLREVFISEIQRLT